MIRRTLLVSMLALALGAGSALGAGAETAAVEAAGRWLSLVDSGRFGESWREAATLLRQSVPKAQWEASVGAARRPFGALLSRRVRGAQYAESLPGAPDGRYVVIQYDAVFERKRSAVETVTPMWDGDAWRVSGYYIK